MFKLRRRSEQPAATVWMNPNNLDCQNPKKVWLKGMQPLIWHEKGFLGTVMVSSCYVNAHGLDQNQDRSVTHSLLSINCRTVRVTYTSALIINHCDG